MRSGRAWPNELRKQTQASVQGSFGPAQQDGSTALNPSVRLERPNFGPGYTNVQDGGVSIRLQQELRGQRARQASRAGYIARRRPYRRCDFASRMARRPAGWPPFAEMLLDTLQGAERQYPKSEPDHCYPDPGLQQKAPACG